MPDDDLAKVIEVINDLARKAVGGNYIFRGEPKCYPKVSSSLYRQYHEIEVEGFDIEVVQRELLTEARKYTPETDDFEILTELQHYGGKTNLIDFTTDYLTALFFACDGSPDKDGRIILLQQSGRQPRNPANRVIAQKSRFVRPPRGFIEPDDTVIIPHDLKHAALNHLRTCHGTSTETIYNDLHGFIRVQDLHRSAYAEFYAGLTSYNNGEYQQAIYHYTESLKLNPQTVTAYNNRGVAYLRKRKFDLAIQDLDKALSLNPDNGPSYCNRGEAWLYLSEWEKAIADLTKALDMRQNIVASFRNEYTSVENFEQKNGVTLPEDIAEMVGGRET